MFDVNKMRTTSMTFDILKLFFLFVPLRSQEVFDENDDRLLKLRDVCTCSEIPDIEGSADLVLNIQCTELDRIKNVPDLDKIQWPENPNGLKISATFEGLAVSILSKLPANHQVTVLKFINNGIKTYWPDPFSEVPNLKKLSLYQNELVQITPDLFTNINLLEDLDLSYNRLLNLNPVDFKTLKKLRKLNLQNNQLKKIPTDALKPLTALEDLDLSKNGIYDVMLQKTAVDTLKGLKRLNLSGNRIRSVMKDTFPENNSIEFLDLSNNIIELVENEAFLTCSNLRELNLGQNNITLIFAIPPTLQIAILKINTMFHWPNFPSGIKYVDISYNRLTALYSDDAQFDNLEALNIGGNQIEELNFVKKLQNLYNLDVSYNLLKEIPESISSLNFPNLEELRVDGNPLGTVYFKNIIMVKRLYMNELNLIKSIESKAFSNVLGRVSDENNGEQKACIHLYLSNCRSLMEIKEGAFDGTSVCLLDISKNNLTHLSQNLLNWSSVIEGVDLEWNPWDCSCDLQWVLDDLMPALYKSHQMLLNDLRCATPRVLDGTRLIHLYNRTDQVMCSNQYRSATGEDYALQGSTSSVPIPKLTTLNIILLACIVVLTIVAVILTIYILATRKKYRIHRNVMRRKRQNAKDNNGAEKEQLSAFNRL